MKITAMLRAPQPVVSFEFFPPKTPKGVESLYHTVEALRACRPSFVSVTYGAGGSTRTRTLDLLARIQKQLGVQTMAHVTCVDATREEIGEVLHRLADAGIENVLALRGDGPSRDEAFRPTPGGFAHADELVQFIRDEGFPFCVGAACYPEGHPESGGLEADLEHLRHKVDRGVDFLISQLFFDNEEYLAFVRRARSAGVDVPIVPGLMPVTNVAQIERFTEVCGARIPQELFRRLSIVRDDPAAVVATGVYWTTKQAERLLRSGVPGLHFYTLNKSSATLAVHAALGL
ncbi:MAG: methylenetetrahydrofolate reductase [NAD(P)H] [Deltaproteobacteria bacterium]|jgi:methylenetetrahydrofolate reductase (NADPH)|nr:methylenetetrahydrofolate reductase [NAD(P)H] [Deltaproteobacteria bacterium]MBW2531789.1 methylenetetrahydrofolate reductase [NAD(P)H] [Deltaproteobacteria bacterium]